MNWLRGCFFFKKVFFFILILINIIRKEESPMHMLRLRLLVDYRTEPIVEKRFRILAHISNQLRKHVKKQLSRLEKDRVYQELKKNTDD